MPTYNFRNKKTGEITEEFMSISAREAFLKKNYVIANRTERKQMILGQVLQLAQKLGATWYVFSESGDDMIYSALPSGVDPRNTKIELIEVIEDHMKKVKIFSNNVTMKEQQFSRSHIQSVTHTYQFGKLSFQISLTKEKYIKLKNFTELIFSCLFKFDKPKNENNSVSKLYPYSLTNS